MPEDFSTFDSVKILGIEYGQFKNWIELRLIKASREEPWGDAFRRYFTRNDLYRTKLFINFLSIGLSRKTASEWISKIQVRPSGSDWARLVFKNGEVDRFGYSGSKDNKIVIKADDETDSVYLVNLINLRRDVDDGIDKLKEDKKKK